MKWLIEFLEKNQIPCQWKYLTGYDCPACGLQRGVIELFKGNILESIFVYPALLPMILSFLLIFVQAYRKDKLSFLFLKISIIFTLTLMFANFIYKLF
ncbi:MAG: DUF2752 domain-containing protein [Bacteroidetes bacterium]|nr:DUF2752 domain-containing protein [Bacteroidota bacterium]